MIYKSTFMPPSDRPASRDLLAYLSREQPDDLLTRLRTQWDWDDDAFARELVPVAVACLREIEDDELVPRRVAAFFAAYLRGLEELLKSPGFLAHNRGVGDAAYFERRVEVVRALVVWFAQGRCPYPAERFELP